MIIFKSDNWSGTKLRADDNITTNEDGPKRRM